MAVCCLPGRLFISWRGAQRKIVQLMDVVVTSRNPEYWKIS